MIFIEKRRFYKAAFCIAVIVLAGVIIYSSTLGAANITFFESIRIILSKIPLIDRFFPAQGLDATHTTIVLNIRMPRIFLALLVGTGLSVVGGTFQGMFRNSMADPYVLGISSGAALGATIGIVAGFDRMLLGVGFVAVCAFIGAILTTLLVYSIARVGSRLPAATLLLSGISLGFLMSSMVTVLMVFNRKQMDQIVFWIMGSFTAASWRHVAMLAPVVIAGSAAIIAFSRDLNALTTGDDVARSLGIEVETVKKILLILSSVVVAACVSVSGIIGFVGLIIPHAVRLMLGSDHRVVLPFSAIGGALFMVFADTLARNLIPPAELPVGAITSLFGAPFFIYLLIKKKKTN
jgi:iron complex transport system permease protein